MTCHQLLRDCVACGQSWVLTPLPRRERPRPHAPPCTRGPLTLQMGKLRPGSGRNLPLELSRRQGSP